MDHTGRSAPRPYVFDVSRLVWRLWRGSLPTGIDRVCLAYLNAFGGRSLAMLQRRSWRVVLSARDSDALFLLLARGPGPHLRHELTRLLARAIPRALARPSHLKGRIYLNVGHTGLDEASLAPWLRRKGLRAVHLVHDLIPITHPQFCRPGEERRHTRRMRNALLSASGIIVNSASTQADLLAFARQEGLTEPALLVAPLGIEPHDPGVTSNPHDRPYFLTIGTIEARKNHILLLRVWEMLRSELGSRTPDLVVIGRRGWEAEQTLSLLDTSRHDHGRIIELSQCNDASLAAWIDHAVAVLMPSHSEGYGLPVVESLARGTPVIASDLVVYHEIAGGVPLLLHSEDEHAWCAALRGMTSDGTEAQRQRAALRDYKAPSWSSHFDLVEAWLTTISDPCHASG